MDQAIVGAERIYNDISRLETALKANIATMAALLAPKRARDSARLNHLILETNNLVHAGFRIAATSGPTKAADMAAAPNDDARAAVGRGWLQVSGPLHRLQIALVKWPMVQSMIRPQVTHRRRALFDDPDRLPDITCTRETVADSLFADLHTLLNPVVQDDGADAHGCFPDIPLAQSLFLKEVHAASRILMAMRPGETSRFLDVGCGCGLKLMSAAKYFDLTVGLEYDPGYVELASGLMKRLPHDRCRVIPGDALQFDRYRDYDVIYFFRPIRDDAVLAQMEARIVEQARPGTLLIAPYRMFEHRFGDYDCVHVAGHVFLTGATDKDATRIRRAAELTGPDVPWRQPTNVPMIWDPLVQACRLNGFEATLSPRPNNKDVNA